MALFGMEIKRRSKRAGTFHVDNINKTSKLRANRTMTNKRLVGTAVSLTLGGFMSYAAMHYIPAYYSTTKVLAMTQIDTSAARHAPENTGRNFLSPYLELFEIKRTYLRAGQRIQAQYAMPKGTVVELRIRECEKKFVTEVFECNVIGEKVIRVSNKTVGTHEFVFKNSGFYMFDERVIKTARSNKPATITWRRS